MENATHLQPDGSGSWEDTWTGTFCQEAPDAHQHTCSQYIAAGYECATMIAEYNCAPPNHPRQSVPLVVTDLVSVSTDDCHCACAR